MESDFLLPAQGHELNVLEVPVVVLDADARGSVLGRRLRVEPRRQLVGRGLRALDAGLQARRICLRKVGELLALLLEDFRSEDPEVTAVAGQIALRLCEQARDRAQPRVHLRGIRFRDRLLVAPELDRALREGALALGLIAFLRKERDVVGGVVRPRFQHPVVEVERAHFRAHDLVVDLLRNGPAGRVDRREPLLVTLERLLLRQPSPPACSPARRSRASASGRRGSPCRTSRDRRNRLPRRQAPPRARRRAPESPRADTRSSAEPTDLLKSCGRFYPRSGRRG